MNNFEIRENYLAGLEEAVELSIDILNTHPPTKEVLKKFHTKQAWMEKLNNGGLLLTAYEEDKLIGFVICALKQDKIFNIWLVGVLEDYRSRGIWKNLYQKVEEYAKNNGHMRLTLGTYKDKYPSMYSFATRHGFVCYKTEMQDGFEKSYFEKQL